MDAPQNTVQCVLVVEGSPSIWILSAQHKPVWGHEAIPLFYLVWADFIPKEIVDSFGGGVMGLYCRMALLVGVVSEWLLFIHGLARSSGIAATLAPYPLWALFDLETVARGLITVLVVPLWSLALAVRTVWDSGVSDFVSASREFWQLGMGWQVHLNQQLRLGLILGVVASLMW
ncbi:hypothetical protein CC1G_11329 [Coprinopsis cinerea okayama7|uniref:Uncharacterized protein n=1 Tax=Coprinopsis cinerea (strain Okayama-7 / 130 / ATCC MYA-4618 / FGSC 9003) TaxID=240176 RepID=A8P5R7_COPC7|nr:hypothetical protein CC1G_11329 [Coprinopsis cinerea okayama7\|eukprot:XP_001839006.1 hypothetical protein CC1G_11329 [Coprinopsis cinerea okayama7\